MMNKVVNSTKFLIECISKPIKHYFNFNFLQFFTKSTHISYYYS